MELRHDEFATRGDYWKARAKDAEKLASDLQAAFDALRAHVVRLEGYITKLEEQRSRGRT